MRKMTREEAIRNYVEHLNGDDLTFLLQHINGYDGSFEEVDYYDMDEFDEVMSNYTPTEIAQMIFYGGEFSPNDEYFRLNAYGNLESANWGAIIAETAELEEEEIIDHLTHYYGGDTPWPDLDDLVYADEDTLFNEDYEEVEEDDEQ